jgi:hypothetical protein
MNKVDFIQLLQAHDWTYQYSDDPSKYKRGQAQREAINKARKELGVEGDALYETYSKVPEARIVVPVKAERTMPKVMCRNTGRMGHLIDKSPNGFMEVKFSDGYRTEFLRQTDIIKLG